MIRPAQLSIFLIDGIGAALSAIFLGLVLPMVQDWVGMPVEVLYTLSMVALIFAAYSFSCFGIVKPHNSWWLKAICLANILYCVLTGLLVYNYADVLTGWGLAYFLAEIAIILVLIFYEKAQINKWSTSI